MEGTPRDTGKSMSKLKAFVGNLDGSRMGLVISGSKKRAAAAAGTSLYDFDNHWREADHSLTLGRKVEILYTRRYDLGEEWTQGYCKLEKLKS